MTNQYKQMCPVAGTLELVGERWTLLIVRDLLPGFQRFQDLSESLPKIAPNILSTRLKLLEKHGIVERRFYSDHPPRAEYGLTPKGRELGLVVGALAVWGSRHVHPDIHLIHASCGNPLEAMFYCPKCGERVRGDRMHLPSAAARERDRKQSDDS